MLLNFSPVILAYLLGSLASAVIVCQLLDLGDPRQDGSGNPGATNVLRLYGRKAAIITLAGDLLKGFIPVVIARLMEMQDFIIALTGIAAFIGHLYPVFFNFRGGKGVATLLGVLIATNWILGLCFIVIWILTALISHYASLSAIVSAIMIPVLCRFLHISDIYFITTILMAVLLIWRHRQNMSRLIAGEESKII